MKTRNTGVKREKTLGSKVNTSDWLTKEHEIFGPLSEWRDITFSTNMKRIHSKIA